MNASRIEIFEQILAGDPANTAVLFGLAKEYEKASDDAKLIDTLERYLAAYIESVRFVREPANKAENVALLMAKLSLPRNVAERTYDLLQDPGFGFTPDAKFLADGFRNLMALRAEVENKQTVPNSGAGYVDLSYYDNAMKLVGR